MQRYPAETSASALLVLAHGAGAGERHPFMMATARGLAERGIEVVTFEFPYMREKRKTPDKAPVLESAFREAVADARGASSMRLFIGGKSMGGRIATHLAAQGLDGLEGVVVLGYPLHPPGRPDRPRVTHLPDIRVPMLIIQGERDAFGTPAELRPVIARMTAPVTLHVVAHGDHSFAVPKSAGATPQDVHATIVQTVAGWIQSA